jgi:hypothetical protein
MMFYSQERGFYDEDVGERYFHPDMSKPTRTIYARNVSVRVYDARYQPYSKDDPALTWLTINEHSEMIYTKTSADTLALFLKLSSLVLSASVPVLEDLFDTAEKAFRTLYGHDVWDGCCDPLAKTGQENAGPVEPADVEEEEEEE